MDDRKRKAPEVTLPAYFEYEGESTGSVFGRDGEPIGRLERGQIVKTETAEALDRVELHGAFRRTTAARYNAQQPPETDAEVAADAPAPTPQEGGDA